MLYELPITATIYNKIRAFEQSNGKYVFFKLADQLDETLFVLIHGSKDGLVDIGNKLIDLEELLQMLIRKGLKEKGIKEVITISCHGGNQQKACIDGIIISSMHRSTDVIHTKAMATFEEYVLTVAIDENIEEGIAMTTTLVRDLELEAKIEEAHRNADHKTIMQQERDIDSCKKFNPNFGKEESIITTTLVRDLTLEKRIEEAHRNASPKDIAQQERIVDSCKKFNPNFIEEESVLDNQLQDLNEYLTNQSEELDPCIPCPDYYTCVTVGGVQCPPITHDKQCDEEPICDGLCKECNLRGVTCFDI